jgi:hypothetical protein
LASCWNRVSRTITSSSSAIMNAAAAGLLNRTWGRLQVVAGETLRDGLQELAWPFVVHYQAVLVALAVALCITPLVYGVVQRIFAAVRASVCLACNLVLSVAGYGVVAAAVGAIAFLVTCALAPSATCPDWK